MHRSDARRVPAALRHKHANYRPSNFAATHTGLVSPPADAGTQHPQDVWREFDKLHRRSTASRPASNGVQDNHPSVNHTERGEAGAVTGGEDPRLAQHLKDNALERRRRRLADAVVRARDGLENARYRLDQLSLEKQSRGSIAMVVDQGSVDAAKRKLLEMSNVRFKEYAKRVSGRIIAEEAGAVAMTARRKPPGIEDVDKLLITTLERFSEIVFDEVKQVAIPTAMPSGTGLAWKHCLVGRVRTAPDTMHFAIRFLTRDDRWRIEHLSVWVPHAVRNELGPIIKRAEKDNDLPGFFRRYRDYTKLALHREDAFGKLRAAFKAQLQDDTSGETMLATTLVFGSLRQRLVLSWRIQPAVDKNGAMLIHMPFVPSVRLEPQIAVAGTDEVQEMTRILPQEFQNLAALHGVVFAVSSIVECFFGPG